MQAVVKLNAGPDWVIGEVPLPTIGDEDVLIKVKAVGICGTDVPILKGIRPVPYPLIPGHEFAGEIVEVGNKVRNFAVGDRVTPAIVIYCGTCYYCRTGHESLCDNLVETGIHVDGAMAEYVSVPQKVLHKLPDEMSYEEAASVDPIASAYHPVKMAKIGSQDFVVIFGPGPIGLYTAQIAKQEGARKIIMIGTNRGRKRLELAKSFGVDEVLIIGEDNLPEKICEITEGKMADIVFECTGNASVVSDVIAVARKNAQIILVGIFHELSKIDFGQVVRRELNIKGSICYSWQDYKECLDLIKDGRLKVDPIITHRFGLHEIDKAMDVIEKRESIKVMLYPER